jgi:hypothetical protein
VNRRNLLRGLNLIICEDFFTLNYDNNLRNQSVIIQRVVMDCRIFLWWYHEWSLGHMHKPLANAFTCISER